MKIKDLPCYTSDILVVVPLEIQKRDPYYKEGDPRITGYIVSQWDKGIWLRKPEEEKNKARVFPFFLESLEEVLEFEIIIQSTVEPINYHNDTENDKTSDTIVEEQK
jgi:hypothetical protein